MITGIDSARPGSRTAVSSLASLSLSTLPPRTPHSVPLVRFGKLWYVSMVPVTRREAWEDQVLQLHVRYVQSMIYVTFCRFLTLLVAVQDPLRHRVRLDSLGGLARDLASPVTPKTNDLSETGEPVRQEPVVSVRN